VALALYGLYADQRGRASHPTLVEGGRLVGALTTGVAVFAVVGSSRGHTVPLAELALLWACTVAVVFFGRYAYRRALVRRFGGEPTLIVGAGVVGQALALKLLADPKNALRVAGFVDPSPRPLAHPRLEAVPVYESLESFGAALDATGATRVVFAFSSADTADTLAIVRECDRRGVDVDVVPRFFELYAHRPRLDSVGGIPLLGPRSTRGSRLDEAVKRVLDAVVSAFLLVLLLPIMTTIALAIRVETPGSPVFRQRRVGRYGRIFSMVKFRTMTVASGAEADEAERTPEIPVKRPDDARVTRVGALLRVTSLDELPQLWNVLRGDMSLVGPRPLPLYEHFAGERVDGQRLEVAPGMTGLWQVLGRSDIAFAERMVLDDLYARNRSLGWDLRLILETVRAVFRRRGAY
jgi:exopolysaccharide biosynthesis polyprenyl glycosylphosphotransferase